MSEIYKRHIDFAPNRERLYSQMLESIKDFPILSHLKGFDNQPLGNSIVTRLLYPQIHSDIDEENELPLSQILIVGPTNSGKTTVRGELYALLERHSIPTLIAPTYDGIFAEYMKGKNLTDLEARDPSPRNRSHMSAGLFNRTIEIETLPYDVRIGEIPCLSPVQRGNEFLIKLAEDGYSSRSTLVIALMPEQGVISRGKEQRRAAIERYKEYGATGFIDFMHSSFPQYQLPESLTDEEAVDLFLKMAQPATSDNEKGEIEKTYEAIETMSRHWFMGNKIVIPVGDTDVLGIIEADMKDQTIEKEIISGHRQNFANKIEYFPEDLFPHLSVKDLTGGQISIAWLMHFLAAHKLHVAGLNQKHTYLDKSHSQFIQERIANAPSRYDIQRKIKFPDNAIVAVNPLTDSTINYNPTSN